MSKFKISASILSADLAHLADDVNKVLSAGADAIHVDVMDNHYVPNLTFGPLICKALRNANITAPLDVHLMVKPVDRLILSFAEAGASSITFHPEASEHVDRSLQLIRDNGCQAGLALNPATPLVYLQHVLPKLDQILIMSVNPGFAGQAFMPEVLPKIKETRRLVSANDLSIRIAVDGGINLETIKFVAEAGADTFIMGSAIFGSKNYSATLAALRDELGSIKQRWFKKQ